MATTVLKVCICDTGKDKNFKESSLLLRLHLVRDLHLTSVKWEGSLTSVSNFWCRLHFHLPATSFSQLAQVHILDRRFEIAVAVLWSSLFAYTGCRKKNMYLILTVLWNISYSTLPLLRILDVERAWSVAVPFNCGAAYCPRFTCCFFLACPLSSPKCDS